MSRLQSLLDLALWANNRDQASLALSSFLQQVEDQREDLEVNLKEKASIAAASFVNNLVRVLPDIEHRACDKNHECGSESSTGSGPWKSNESETNVHACATTVELPDRPEATHRDSASRFSSKTWPSSPEGIFRFQLQECIHIVEQAKNRQSILQCIERVMQETERRICDFAATSSRVGQHYTIELVLHPDSSYNTTAFTVGKSKVVALPSSASLAEDGHQSPSLAGPPIRGENNPPTHFFVQKIPEKTDGSLELPPQALPFASQTRLPVAKVRNTCVPYFEHTKSLRGEERGKPIVLESSIEPGDCCKVDTVLRLSQAENSTWQTEASAPFVVTTTHQKTNQSFLPGDVAGMSSNAEEMSQPASRCTSPMERRLDCTKPLQHSGNHDKKPIVTGGTHTNTDPLPSVETGWKVANIADISEEPLESTIAKESRLREDRSMPLVEDTAAEPVMRKRCPPAKPSPDHFIGLLDLVRKKQKSTL